MPAWELPVTARFVTTKGDTTNPLTHVLTRAFPGRRVETVRIHLLLEAHSGDIELRVVFQTSNDGATWSSDTTITGYTTYYGTADTWSYGTTFATISDAPFVRFCVQAKNASGTEIDAARVTALIDVRYG